MENYHIILGFLTLLISQYLAPYLKKKQSIDDEQTARLDAQSEGIKCLLRYQLYRTADDIRNSLFASVPQREIFLEHYQAYKALGGNGEIDLLKTELGL